MESEQLEIPEIEKFDNQFEVDAIKFNKLKHCLLYTSDAADERSSVDLGGCRTIKKKTTVHL